MMSIGESEMMAPNGDQPNPHWGNHNARAIPMEPTFYPRRFTQPQDGVPIWGTGPELSLIYLLVGATVLLLLIAFIWSVVN
jgi:hypothetical protein